MNERIKELALQAGFHPFVRGEQILFDISTEDQLKEFAELIVRECARISVEADDTMTNQGTASAQAFMEHFGVKE
jgi:hypothetical protein